MPEPRSPGHTLYAAVGLYIRTGGRSAVLVNVHTEYATYVHVVHVGVKGQGVHLAPVVPSATWCSRNECTRGFA